MGLRDWFGKRKATIPDVLWAPTIAALPFLANLAVDEQKRLKTLVEDFLAEKEFSTAGGLELSDEICVSIAAQGCLPILELGLAAYRGWVGIVVYPDEFVVTRRIEDDRRHRPRIRRRAVRRSLGRRAVDHLLARRADGRQRL